MNVKLTVVMEFKDGAERLTRDVVVPDMPINEKGDGEKEKISISIWIANVILQGETLKWSDGKGETFFDPSVIRVVEVEYITE